MRSLVFNKHAVEDLLWWLDNDRRTARKILLLATEALSTPFAGSGKPEALKYDLKGCWSRRITGEHRLVYEVTTEHVRILVCRFHYDR